MASQLDSILETDLSRTISVLLWLKSGAPIFIYGTGTIGQDVGRLLTEKGISITAYMDHRTHEIPFLQEIPIIEPDSPSNSNKGKSVIILAIHNREANLSALITWLKSLGYKKLITMIDLYDHFASELGTRYWLTARIFYRYYKTQINAANELWADDLSRDIYVNTIKFRLTGDYSLLHKPDLEYQYFPQDLPLWKQPIRMIDCGAYNGNSIGSLIINGYSFSALAAFEPDIENYGLLTNFIQDYGKRIPEVSLWPCGVHATPCKLRFSSGTGESSSIKESGKTVIQCVALDEALPNFGPTLIKMDIEGAELDALLGTRHLIRAYQPTLALSAYHLPAHLWQIPLWVAQFANENGLSYTYHLRSHGYNCFETVFYAVPNL